MHVFFVMELFESSDELKGDSLHGVNADFPMGFMDGAETATEDGHDDIFISFGVFDFVDWSKALWGRHLHHDSAFFLESCFGSWVFFFFLEDHEPRVGGIKDFVDFPEGAFSYFFDDFKRGFYLLFFCRLFVAVVVGWFFHLFKEYFEICNTILDVSFNSLKSMAIGFFIRRKLWRINRKVIKIIHRDHQYN